jgi:hypothetical protein
LDNLSTWFAMTTEVMLTCCRDCLFSGGRGTYNIQNIYVYKHQTPGSAGRNKSQVMLAGMPAGPRQAVADTNPIKALAPPQLATVVFLLVADSVSYQVTSTTTNCANHQHRDRHNKL